MRSAALKVGESRLQSLSTQLGSMLSGNTHTLISTTHKLANKLSVAAFLKSNGRDSSAAVYRYLEDFRKDSSNIKIELLDGKKVQILKRSDAAVDSALSHTLLTNVYRREKLTPESWKYLFDRRFNLFSDSYGHKRTEELIGISDKMENVNHQVKIS